MNKKQIATRLVKIESTREDFFDEINGDVEGLNGLNTKEREAYFFSSPILFAKRIIYAHDQMMVNDHVLIQYVLNEMFDMERKNREANDLFIDVEEENELMAGAYEEYTYQYKKCRWRRQRYIGLEQKRRGEKRIVYHTDNVIDGEEAVRAVSEIDWNDWP